MYIILWEVYARGPPTTTTTPPHRHPTPKRRRPARERLCRSPVGEALSSQSFQIKRDQSQRCSDPLCERLCRRLGFGIFAAASASASRGAAAPVGCHHFLFFLQVKACVEALSSQQSTSELAADAIWTIRVPSGQLLASGPSEKYMYRSI